jgi:hypothetical protein
MKWEEWRLSAYRAWQDPFLRYTCIASGVCMLGMSGFAFFKLIPEGIRSSVLTLHYNVYLGIDDVKPWWWIVYPVIGMLVLFCLNVVCAIGIFREHILAARALAAVTALMVLLWSLHLFFLVLVNV